MNLVMIFFIFCETVEVSCNIIDIKLELTTFTSNALQRCWHYKQVHKQVNQQKHLSLYQSLNDFLNSRKSEFFFFKKDQACSLTP